MRVVALGPESTGKTTLATRLAARFGARLVPEHLRAWVDAHPKPPGAVMVTAAELAVVARAQVADEERHAAAPLVVCDTDALGLAVYGAYYLGDVPPDVQRLAARTADLALLLAPDVPWVPDPQRDRPHARWELFERFRTALAGRPTVEIRGDWARREATAVAAIEARLAR